MLELGLGMGNKHDGSYLKSKNYDPIPHLWAAGNVAGGRYAAEYPVAPVVATSHGTAFTFGRSIGYQMAAGDAPAADGGRWMAGSAGFENPGAGE